jgi:hypothetical protein
MDATSGRWELGLMRIHAVGPVHRDIGTDALAEHAHSSHQVLISLSSLYVSGILDSPVSATYGETKEE